MKLFRCFARPLAAVLLCLICAAAKAQEPLPRFDGERALTYTKEFVATGPRWIGSKGHAKAQAYLERQFAKDIHQRLIAGQCDAADAALVVIDDQALQQNIDQQSRVLFDPQALIGQKEEAARLLEKSADADRIVAMTVEGLKEFEWRSQRIRDAFQNHADRDFDHTLQLPQYWYLGCLA